MPNVRSMCLGVALWSAAGEQSRCRSSIRRRSPDCPRSSTGRSLSRSRAPALNADPLGIACNRTLRLSRADACSGGAAVVSAKADLTPAPPGRCERQAADGPGARTSSFAVMRSGAPRTTASAQEGARRRRGLGSTNAVTGGTATVVGERGASRLRRGVCFVEVLRSDLRDRSSVFASAVIQVLRFRGGSAAVVLA